MKYSKKKVNIIIDQIINCIGIEHIIGIENELDFIREEHLLIDRRVSSINEYVGEIIVDFLELKYSYKELMKKYHCSMRTIRSLLIGAAHNDERVKAEIQFRSRG